MNGFRQTLGLIAISVFTLTAIALADYDISGTPSMAEAEEQLTLLPA